jgi:hypothetical protein
MKYFFFIDNFRGFSNTCIPITDVNFLVGENSTGKTSVLSLLKLISGPQFLIRPVFSDEYVNFGHFSDMVSASAHDRSYFRIGLIFAGSSEDREPPGGYLLTFVQDGGLPRLSKVTICRASEQLSVRFHGDIVTFKREKVDIVKTAQDIISRSVPQWIDEHCASDKGYQRVELPMDVSRQLPVMLMLSLVWAQSFEEKSNTKKETELFDIPPRAIHAIPPLTWIAPIRTKPRRTYDELMLDFSPEGAHTPYVIRRLLRSKSKHSKFHAFVRSIGKASGLFQDVRIKNFGRGATAPFEVDIVIDDTPLNLSTVGYGVSQSLPVFVEVLARARDSWFAIQQPEVHLHPRAQAALGDLFFELAVVDRKCFLIETHSDFAIDRFRMNYQNGQAKNKPDSQILFFERRDKHNVVTPISIGQSGELSADQPDGYREFFIREEMRLLGI